MNSGITEVEFDPVGSKNCLEGTRENVSNESSGTVPRFILPPPGFELIEEIGRGGMGIVYRARDLEFDREVALKFLQPKYDGDSQQAHRFMEEARITGQLQHPGIPAVHQTGKLPDGSPYLVMKLIRGYTLSDLLWKKKSGSQENDLVAPHVVPANYLSIFEAICQAMGYAHAHLVIHRDLKPHNIMVGAFGEVQVMDWGLAKVLHHDQVLSTHPDVPADTDLTVQYHESHSKVTTHNSELTTAGSVLGTPAYMPPEQALGANDNLDTRSDVFGLGAILCCLLTGKPPFLGDHPESTRLLSALGMLGATYDRLDVCGAEPDLIALAKRCLSFKREDRPDNGEVVARAVAQLRAAADERVKQAEIERTKATIHAEEQHQKRRMVMMAGATVMTVLLVGIIGTTWGLLRAHFKGEEALLSASQEHQAKLAETEQRKKAESKEAEIQTVLDFVENKIFAAARPLGLEQGLGSNVMLKQVLEKALDSIADNFATQPVIEARIRMTLGKSFQFLGELQVAMEQLKKAQLLRDQHLGPGHRDSIVSLLGLANLQEQMEQYKEALDARERAFQLSKQQFGPENHVTQMAMNNLASSYEQLKQNKDALVLREQVLALTQLHRGHTDPFTMLCMNNLAVAYMNQGRLQEAFKLLEEAIALQKKYLGEAHPNTLESMSSLAECLGEMKRHHEALLLFETILKRRKEALGHSHPHTLQSMIDVAACYAKLNRHAEALQLVRNALPLYEKRLGNTHGETLFCLSMIVSQLFHLNRDEEAKPLIDTFFNRSQMIRCDSKLLSTMFAFQYRYHRNRRDLAACLNTIRSWEQNKLVGIDVYLELALAWSSIAQLKKELEKPGLAEADQAMEYLQKAVDQGWDQVQQLETDPKFDFLRNRDDFRVLLIKLKKKLEKKP